MNNELTQDAEESATIAKTAEDQAGSTTQADISAAPENTAAGASESSQPEAAPAQQEPAVPAESAPEQAAPPAAAPAQSAAPAAAAEPADDPSASNEIDFGAILEQFEQEQTVFHTGELVNGTVVGVTDRGVLVDFGYKSEGFVPLEEFTNAEGEMTAKVGEPVEVTIRTMHPGDGAPQLSRMDALGRKVWDEIDAAYQNQTPITGRVIDKTKGGLRVDLNGIEAFLPGSQIDSRPIRGLDTYIGQDIEALVIKFSRRRNNIVLSRKVITDKVVNEQKAETLGKIEVGHIVDGVIKNLTEYGAFVDIGGIDGLLHVTDMSWGRIHHPGDQFKVGEHLQVKVLKLDREKEKVSLGYKQLQPDPWSTVVEVYPVNTKLTGTVSSVTEYGVFVELEPGVEGLVHVSEISWSRRSQSPKRMFQKGQEVEVQVLGVDTVEKRISLGMKQFQENPWDSVDIKYPIGTKIIGKVRNLTDFGAFIELEEGIDGLVHVSDISWAKKIKHPKDVLKKDQEVEAVVTSIDKRGQRLSLSMKDLTPSAWEGFAATHRPGDVVRGTVTRFTNFGIFVEIGEGLEGLCHISELSDERVDRPESVAQLGQEMDFKILRIEQGDQKIGLSARAVGKEDEPIVDTRIYSSEAKGGMASLGELANLRVGGAEPAEEVVDDPEARKEAKKAAKKAKAEEFAAREAEAARAAEAGETAETEGEAAPEGETSTDDSAAVEAGETAETESEAAPEGEISTDDSAAAEAPAAEEAPVSEAAPSEEAAAPASEDSQAAPTEEAAAPAAEETAAPSEEAQTEEAPAAETATEEPAAETPAEEPAAETAAEASAETGDEAVSSEAAAPTESEAFAEDAQSDEGEDSEKQSA